MKKAIAIAMAIGMLGGVANAQRMVSCPNEPGSILVYPCIDNVDHSTIIEIANLGNTNVFVQGYMLVQRPGVDDDETWVIKDFIIHITAKEPFYWNTSLPYNRTNVEDVVNQIQSFDGYYGCLFVVAVQSRVNPLEIDFDFLKGDALLLDGTRAWQYNAIPHQVVAIDPNRVLDLNGVEYTKATRQIMVEGFAGNLVGDLSGHLGIASLDGLDLIESKYVELDLNIWAWNQNEVPQSRHLDFDCCEKYDLVDDLQLDITQIFTAKWQASVVANGAIYGVFSQRLGTQEWGGNTFQHPDAGEDATVVLDPIPLAP